MSIYIALAVQTNFYILVFRIGKKVWAVKARGDQEQEWKRFEWASIKTFRRMPKSEVLVMVLVTLVTVFLHNLALAVLVGVIISALVFAWDNAKMIRAGRALMLTV